MTVVSATLLADVCGRAMLLTSERLIGWWRRTVTALIGFDFSMDRTFIQSGQRCVIGMGEVFGEKEVKYLT